MIFVKHNKKLTKDIRLIIEKTSGDFREIGISYESSNKEWYSYKYLNICLYFFVINICYHYDEKDIKQWHKNGYYKDFK